MFQFLLGKYKYVRPYCLSGSEEQRLAVWLSSWLAEQEDRGSISGLATWIFRDWLSPASKSRYDWKIAKSTLIQKKKKKTTNQPTNQPVWIWNDVYFSKYYDAWCYYNLNKETYAFTVLKEIIVEITTFRILFPMHTWSLL